MAESPAPIAYELDDFSPPWESVSPAVLLHGFARSAEFWRGWVPVLSDARAVVRPDHRGCGRSAGLAPSSYSTGILVGDLIGLLDRLGIERAHLVGESSGGLVAAYAAAWHPDRVASATLVSTPVRPAGHDASVKSAGFDSTEDALRTVGLRGWWLESRRRGGELAGDARDGYYADQAARTPVSSALAMWDWIHDPAIDLMEIATDLTPPVLLATPGSSHGTTVDQQRALEAALPDGRMHLFEGFNHEMYYLRAAEVARVAAAFMAECDEPRG
ncbi:alpha/beta hydrolase [Nocardioides sp. LHD-245]|uniref:alpha/beta fold hydrolase n=1 Tax=Nocardioides sp. LHD-245 TaxID=3051387 RepID=UPI0027DFC19E|nr:alpha/beta hydrolase [Nocardioides sp. LHD-245]